MRRVVITGVGVVSRYGTILPEIKKALFEERSFIKRASSPCVFTAPISSFDIKNFFPKGSYKNFKYLNRGAQFALTSAHLALKEKHPLEDRHRMGVFVGAGPHFGDEKDQEQALWILRYLPNTQASLLAQRHEIFGESHTLTTACCASMMAIGEAFRRIKYGELEVALAGGGDSRLTERALKAYDDARALFRRDDDKEYIPFGVERFGFIPGEGGAFFVLESLESAQKYGRAIYGEIVGYGLSCDAGTPTAPHPTGDRAKMAVVRALKESLLSPQEIDMICAHGTGTALNDQIEALMLKDLFGEHLKKTPILALKSFVGHLSAACGAMELALLMALRTTSDDKITLAPIPFLQQSLDEDLFFLKEPLTLHSSQIKYVLLENFGFGGQNAALVIKFF